MISLVVLFLVCFEPCFNLCSGVFFCSVIFNSGLLCGFSIILNLFRFWYVFVFCRCFLVLVSVPVILRASFHFCGSFL